MKTEKVILGVDIGYSFVKVCVGTGDGQIIKKFKFPSVIGQTKKLEGVQNDNIVHYNERYYMVGEDAKHLPSSNIIALDTQKNREDLRPLLLNHAVKIAKLSKVDLIVSGLSIAEIKQSGYFQNVLSHFVVDGVEYNYNVMLLPQGAGAKLCYEKFGNDFPNLQKEYLGDSTYCIVDIGFNTLDLVLVNKGVTSPELFEGISQHGLMKIAAHVAKLVNEKHNRSISLPEAREILDTGVYKLRGQKYDYTEEIEGIKKEYLREILALVNERYSNILDKLDFLVVLGGGAHIFKSSSDGYIRCVIKDTEYYNAIGEFIFGTNNIDSVEANKEN